MPVQKITKEEIVRKAIIVFRKQGYNKTSMRDLAQACGLQKGSFYHYFSSKEALMLEVLTTLLEYYRKKIFAIAYEVEMSPLARLQAFFDQQAPIFTQDLAGCLFGNITLETISVEAEFRRVLQAFFEDWTGAFAHLFVQAGASEEEAIKAARQTVMQIEGALMMMRVFQDIKLLGSACNWALERLKRWPKAEKK